MSLSDLVLVLELSMVTVLTTLASILPEVLPEVHVKGWGSCIKYCLYTTVSTPVAIVFSMAAWLEPSMIL
jgi:hypothetical protein